MTVNLAAAARVGVAGLRRAVVNVTGCFAAVVRGRPKMGGFFRWILDGV